MEKWPDNTNRKFTQDKIEMANKHKKPFNFTNIQKIQLKATTR